MPNHISARVDNRENHHEAVVSTNGSERSLILPPQPSGLGSSANGGELLFLALATCYCNDIYREAALRGITVRRVEVVVSGQFDPEPGSTAFDVTYHATVEAEALAHDIIALMRHTDKVAEIQNTLRHGTSVILDDTIAISV